MPIRHGTHHGLSFVIAIALSTVLTETIRDVLPEVRRFIDSTTMAILHAINADMDVRYASILLIGFLVAVIYGVVFGIFERNRAN